MKRLFFAISALAVMASCNNEELIEEAPKQAITFGNAFVDNATRAIDPSYTSDNLDKFIVYGTVRGTETDEGTANIFSGVEVKKVTQGFPAEVGAVLSDKWWYSGSNVQYWINGNKYNFTAIAGVESTAVSVDQGQKMPTKITYDANGQKDLLYVKNDEYTSNGSDDAVKFTFNHLLAKAQFTFKNTITTNTDNNKYCYKVSNVKISQAYKQGIYYIVAEGTNAANSWTPQGTKSEYLFGNITNQTDVNSAETAISVGAVGSVDQATSHYQRLLVPHAYGTDRLVISCTIETLLNSTVINSESFEKEIENITLEAGHAYNFVISKGNPGDPIKFSLQTVNNWNPNADGEGKDI